LGWPELALAERGEERSTLTRAGIGRSLALAKGKQEERRDRGNIGRSVSRVSSCSPLRARRGGVLEEGRAALSHGRGGAEEGVGTAWQMGTAGGLVGQCRGGESDAGTRGG
jgi:hypothetical protein